MIQITKREPQNPEGVEAPHTLGSPRCNAASALDCAAFHCPGNGGIHSTFVLMSEIRIGAKICSVLLRSKSILRCDLAAGQFSLAAAVIRHSVVALTMLCAGASKFTKCKT